MSAKLEGMNEYLSYDDVLLLPAYADFMPGEANVTTEIARGISLNVPIISAAMDTVTEQDMAIALALEGGVGVIHRNMTPAEQAKQVAAVKRYLNWIIDNPLSVESESLVRDAWELMNAHDVSGLPVVNGGLLRGIITSRDLRFCSDYDQPVSRMMTPDPVVEKGTPSITSAQAKFNEYKIEKLPVVDDNYALTGLITVKDIEKHQRFPNAAIDSNGRLLVGAAVSPNDIDERVPGLVDSRADFVVVDTAHGHTKGCVAAVEKIKTQFDIPVMAGNIATRDGARALIDAGADSIKVGVGPGSICTTRVVAGIGVPQFTAVVWAAEEAAQHGVPVIADGGIKYSGDIVKAIAAGASAVMAGNLFAGLKESPGREIMYEGRIFKVYRGMGSLGAIRTGGGDRYRMSQDEEPVPEGVEGRVPYRGELAPFLRQLVSGLRKGMGYTGCPDIASLRSYSNFIKISAAGLREGHVHDVAVTHEPPNYSRS
ncbi:MAG: IMP dehydrogenase [Spirochaetales bacterium]